MPTANGPTRGYLTANAPNAIAGLYYSNTGIPGGSSTWGPANFPRLKVRFYPEYHTTLRAFIGFWNVFSAPTSTADMLNGRGGIGLWVDTAVTTNWRIMHNDGSGASTVSTLNPATAISPGDLNMVEILGGTSFQTVTISHPGVGYSRNIVQTDIMTSGVWGFLFYVETLDTLKRWFVYDLELGTR